MHRWGMKAHKDNQAQDPALHAGSRPSTQGIPQQHCRRSPTSQPHGLDGGRQAESAAEQSVQGVMLGGWMGRSVLYIQFSTASSHGSAAAINTSTEKPVFKGSQVLVLVRTTFSFLPGKHKEKTLLVLLSLSRYQKSRNFNKFFCSGHETDVRVQTVILRYICLSSCEQRHCRSLQDQPCPGTFEEPHVLHVLLQKQKTLRPSREAACLGSVQFSEEQGL